VTRPARKAGEEVHPLPPAPDPGCIACYAPVSLDGEHECRATPESADRRWLESVAATTSPPVRVIRLDSGIHGPRRTLDALEAAMLAAAAGADAVEACTRPGSAALPSWTGFIATRAAHFARLALGATLEAP
jgi:hypothetical protein